MSAARSKNTYFCAKYQRIKARRGPMRGLVAVEHALTITAWNMLTDGTLYRELGADYYTMRKPAKAKAGAVSQLEALGYTVTLTPLAETAYRQPAVDQWSPARVTVFSCQCALSGEVVLARASWRFSGKGPAAVRICLSRADLPGAITACRRHEFLDTPTGLASNPVAEARCGEHNAQVPWGALVQARATLLTSWSVSAC